VRIRFILAATLAVVASFGLAHPGTAAEQIEIATAIEQVDPLVRPPQADRLPAHPCAELDLGRGASDPKWAE
jgi:hypothetical protein